MPDRRGNRPARHLNQGQEQRQEQRQDQSQDERNSIPFYNARLFAMYESLIQSYTHFTYHSNHMFHVLERALHGTQNSINSNLYPWLINPSQSQRSYQSQPMQSQPMQSQPMQSQPMQSRQPHPMNAWRSADMRDPLRTPPPPPLRTPPPPL